jgi:hypothetical protein
LAQNEKRLKLTANKATKKAKSQKGQKPVGRPEFQPTSEQRSQVKALAMAGMSYERIAASLQIAPSTLTKHFERELTEAIPHLMATATSTVFNTMRSPDKKLALSSAMFTLSTKGKHFGWTTSQDRAAYRDVWSGADPSKLTHDEFRLWVSLAQKMGVVFEDVHMPPGRELPLLTMPTKNDDEPDE